MKTITCLDCGDTFPDFDVAHVCSRGPYAVKLKLKLKPNMHTQTVILKVVKSVNEHNELQPNLYTVIDNNVELFTTHDGVYALQVLLNRTSP